MEKQKATEVGCQACKKGLSGSQKGIIFFSFYLLFAAIIGTIEIFKYLVSLFN